MNTIFTIFPRVEKGVLLFDDAERGIIKEPFVLGAGDILVNSALQANQDLSGFPLHFSAEQFPESIPANAEEKEFGGRWYNIAGVRGWLCAATLKYFKEFPETIYFQIPTRKV